MIDFDNAKDTAEETVTTEASTTEAVATQPEETTETVEEVPQYTPNFKYKTLDTEKEFEEWMRPAIKSKEIEDKVRDYYTKIDGFDHVKESRAKLSQELEEIRPHYTQVTTELQTLAKLYQAQDSDSFFKRLGVSDDFVLKHALRKLELKEMSPEKRQEYEQYNQTRERAMLYEQQNQQLSQQYQDLSVKLKMQEINTSLARQDVSSFAQEFDARVGQPGSFRNEVIKRGQYHAFHGKEVTADEAINEVMTLAGGYKVAQTKATDGTPVVTQTNTHKQTIPNIQGHGSSPAKKMIKSIDQLKEIGRKLEAQDTV